MSGLSSVKIVDSVIQFSDSINILGATLDSNLITGHRTNAISNFQVLFLSFTLFQM